MTPVRCCIHCLAVFGLWMLAGCNSLPGTDAPREYLRGTIAGLIGVPYQPAQEASKTSTASGVPVFSRAPGHLSRPFVPDPGTPATYRTIDGPQLEGRAAEIVARRPSWHPPETRISAPELQSVRDHASSMGRGGEAPLTPPAETAVADNSPPPPPLPPAMEPAPLS
jgi:hypothetical protein